MPRKKTAIISAISVLFLAFTGIILARFDRFPAPAPKPQPSPTENSPEPQWYIQFTVKDQKVTAYTEASYARKSASGNYYYLGSVAVHPIYPGVDPRQPIIPFGTEIILSEPIVVQGNTYDSFTVVDTGDVLYGRYGQTPYWFDVYHGTANYQNNKASREFGIDTRDYTWIEKWR